MDGTHILTHFEGQSIRPAQIVGNSKKSCMYVYMVVLWPWDKLCGMVQITNIWMFCLGMHVCSEVMHWGTNTKSEKKTFIQNIIAKSLFAAVFKINAQGFDKHAFHTCHLFSIRKILHQGRKKLQIFLPADAPNHG